MTIDHLRNLFDAPSLAFGTDERVPLTVAAGEAPDAEAYFKEVFAGPFY